MIEVDYSLTVSPGFLENMAEKFTAGYGKKVSIKDNALVFPPGLATGRFEHYLVDAGFSVCIIDCVFMQEVKFNRLPAAINYFHALSFNLGTISFMVEQHNTKGVHIGETWKNKIIYSTSEKGLGWTAPENSRIRMVVLYFTRSWLEKNYSIHNLPPDFPYAEELMNDQALQFNLDLDLDLLLMLQEILASPAPKYMAKLYFEGCARKLVATVASRLADLAAPENRLKYEEVAQVLDMERTLEERLDQPLPSLEDLAQECFMSKSKFEKMFKAIFGKNVTDLFQNIRMKKAAELLKQGWEPGKVSQMVGFSTTSHFTKVFKIYYKTTPKTYQVSLAKK